MKTWDEMTARERDALVAVEVMGWEFLEVGYHGLPEAEGGATPRQIELKEWLASPEVVAYTGNSVGDYFVDVAGDMIRRTGSFEPSTDIAAAWEVVEKMRAEGVHFAIESDVVDDEWEVDIHVDAPESDYGRERVCRPAYHTSLPEAICIAAVRAKGVEV